MFSVIIFHLLDTIVSSSFFILCVIILSPYLDKKCNPRWRKYIWLIIGIFMLFALNPFADLHSFIPTININCFANRSNIIYPVLFVCWITGAVIYLRIQILQFKHFQNQLLDDSDVIDSQDILSLFKKIKSQYKVEKNIVLYTCDKINTPMVLGVFQTIMLLPATSYSEEALEGIFQHECCHIKHYDAWYKIFILGIKSLYWFNPLVYIMAKYSYHDLELICDMFVTENMSQEQKINYSQALLESMQQKKVKDIPLSSCFYGSKNMLNQRIRYLFHTKQHNNGYPFVLFFLCFFLLLSNCITFGEAKGNISSEDVVLPSESDNSMIVSNDLPSNITSNLTSQDSDSSCDEELTPDEERILQLQKELFSDLSDEEINYVKESIRNIHWKFESIMVYRSDSYQDLNSESWGMLDDDSEIYEEKTAQGIDCYSCNYYTDILNSTKELVNNEIYSKNIDLATATLKEAVTNRDFKMLMTFHEIMHDIDYWLIGYPVSNFKMGPPDWHGIYVYYNVLQYN